MLFHPSKSELERVKKEASGNYKKYDDLPWWERGILDVGSGIEGIAKSLFGIVGAEDYAPSSITDEKEKIKRDIAQKGSSEGWDWGTFWDGTQGGKIAAKLMGEGEDDDGSSASSLKTGAGVSGGGENTGDDLKNRLGFGSQSPGRGSLGKALAIQEDPALQDVNYNRNNFSF